MPLIRRRPLLRAAAIGGGAYYAGKKRMESQQREHDERARTEPAAQLEQLGKLHADGVLTDEEFAAAKARLLA